MSKIIQDISIGVNLQKLRKAKGLTQEQVCAQMAIAGRPTLRSTYSQIERGSRNIFVSDLIVLAKIFDTGIEKIFKDLEPINKYDTNINFSE